MSLADFKSIYFWEYTHRLLGRLIGIAFAVPLGWFWIRGKLPRRLKPALAGILALGFAQGLLGWYMVESGLVRSGRGQPVPSCGPSGAGAGDLRPDPMDRARPTTKACRSVAWECISGQSFRIVMAGLDPASHVFARWPDARRQHVDARIKSGHDGFRLRGGPGGSRVAARGRRPDRAGRTDDCRRRVCRRNPCRAHLQHLPADGRPPDPDRLRRAPPLHPQLVREHPGDPVRPSPAGDDDRRRGAAAMGRRPSRALPAPPASLCGHCSPQQRCR